MTSADWVAAIASHFRNIPGCRHRAWYTEFLFRRPHSDIFCQVGSFFSPFGQGRMGPFSRLNTSFLGLGVKSRFAGLGRRPSKPIMLILNTITHI